MNTVKACRTRTHVVMVAGAIAILSLAGTGSLAWAAEPIRVHVSYADLNIQSAAGVRSLYGRLRSAAQKVCAPLDDGRYSPSNIAFQGCYRTALDSAVARFNSSTLTAMHARARQVAGG
jgi:UrcA family protein